MLILSPALLSYCEITAWNINSYWKIFVENKVLLFCMSFKLWRYFPYLMQGGMHAQSCPTLWDTMDYSPPGSSVHEISQARILEWIVMPSSRGSSQSRDRTHVSCISCTAGRFFTTEPPGKPRVMFMVHQIDKTVSKTFILYY